MIDWLAWDAELSKPDKLLPVWNMFGEIIMTIMWRVTVESNKEINYRD